MLLNHRDGLRKLHDAQLARIRSAEVDVDTDVLQLQDRTDISTEAQLRALDRLKQRLLMLMLERDRLISMHYDKLSEVELQLMQAISRRAQLDF